MSHEIVKSITIKHDTVYITSAVNNIRPLHFQKWEWERASEALVREGRLAALSMIGKNIWDGNFHLYKGTKFCNLFLKAREALPHGLSFMNFDSDIAGEYLGKMVLKLESNISADLTPEVKEMLCRIRTHYLPQIIRNRNIRILYPDFNFLRRCIL